MRIHPVDAALAPRGRTAESYAEGNRDLGPNLDPVRCRDRTVNSHTRSQIRHEGTALKFSFVFDHPQILGQRELLKILFRHDLAVGWIKNAHGLRAADLQQKIDLRIDM